MRFQDSNAVVMKWFFWKEKVFSNEQKLKLTYGGNMWVSYLGQEHPLEEGMATQSSILVWRIPWTEETGGLQSIRLQRVRHN